MASIDDVHALSGEVLAAARRLIPERGSGVDSVALSTSTGRSVTLTPEDGERFDRNAGAALGQPRAGGGRTVDPETGEVVGGQGEAESARGTVTAIDPDARAKVPGGHRFQGRDGRQLDFIEGRDIQDIADALILARDTFGFLDDVIIRYRWRRKAQNKAGKAVLGFCQKLSGQLKDEMGGGEFQIVLNAEHCRDFQLTNLGLEALVAHELRHIAPPDPDDPDSEATLVGHDVECFADDIREYGLWTADLRRVAPAFEQARLEGL